MWSSEATGRTIWQMRAWSVTLFVGVLALGLVSAALAGSTPSPPVTSLRALAPPPKLPPGFAKAIGRGAVRVGISRATALHRTRLLLSDVTGLPLYAFAGTQGRVCFLVWRGIGNCGRLDGGKDVLWAMNGGNDKRGQALVGVVSDRVRAVDVEIRGRRFRAPVRHNAFVVPFRYHDWDSGLLWVKVTPVIR
jgi:hypothetical protein